MTISVHIIITTDSNCSFYVPTLKDDLLTVWSDQ